MNTTKNFLKKDGKAEALLNRLKLQLREQN